MVKIDKRKKYLIVVDVETAGSLARPLCYDIGFAITDKKGNIVEKRSYVVSEIFDNVKLMTTAYYASKIPMYVDGLASGKFIKKPFEEIRNEMLYLMDLYNVTALCAYNLNFDMKALSSTNMLLRRTKKFMHRPVELLCLWSFACEVIYTQKNFYKVAIREGWVSDAGNLRTSAEMGHRYISGQYDFIEEHTGLADVEIEVGIMAKCFSQHKKHDSGILSHPWRIPKKHHGL